VKLSGIFLLKAMRWLFLAWQIKFGEIDPRGNVGRAVDKVSHDLKMSDFNVF